jgi:hypothetical protein
MTTLPATAALLFALLAGGVGVFQLALVLGAPWGEFTLGGRWPGRLPASGRWLAALSLMLLVVFSVLILARAGLGLGLAGLEAWSRPGAWVVVAYCALGSVANVMTRSRRERRLWLPVVLCMLGLSLVVAGA